MGRETETEGPAVRALASLFKLTNSYLWDDAVIDTPEVPSVSIRHLDSLTEDSTSAHSPASIATISSDTDPTIGGFTISVEDTELVRQMNELGLPISFSTNKERSIVTTNENRKALRPKSVSSRKHVKDRLARVPRVSERESVVPPIVCKDSASTPVYSLETNGHSDSSRHCFAEDNIKLQFCSGEGHCQEQVSKEVTDVKTEYGVVHDDMPDNNISKDNAVVVHPIIIGEDKFASNSLQVTNSCFDHEEVDKVRVKVEGSEGSSTVEYNADTEKVPFDNRISHHWIDAVESSQSNGRLDANCQYEVDGFKCNNDDWMAIWDAFYMRNYFYNIRTNESTWDPPPGMEHLALSDIAAESSEMIADAAKDSIVLDSACDDTNIKGLHGPEGNTVLFQEVKGDDNLSNQPLQTLSVGMEHATSNLVSYPPLSKRSDDCVYSGVVEGKTNCSGTQKISDDLYLIPSHSSPYTQSNIDSLPNIVDPSGSEEIWRSDSQSMLMNSGKDELCDIKCLDKTEENITCIEINKLSDDAIVQVPDVESSTAAEACYSGCWRSDMQLICMASAVNDQDSNHDRNAIKKKKKVRTRSRRKTLSYDNEGLAFQGMLAGFSVDIVKYWCQRYLLFSRFDDGVKMDEEGWFSITPEAIARHHASRCGSGTVIDCFTGVGGNAIQFAMRSNHVIAIDIDPQKIDYAQNNATIYGVNEKIDFIKGDFFQFSSKLKGDTVFMSPPWGGPDYAKVQTYDISSMLKPHNGYFLFKTGMGIASRIVMFLPRNVDLNQLAELSLLAHPPWQLEVEKNFLNGKLKAITAYFSQVPQ